mmetsp:Transcript_8259/g.23720  ORF Transcript_8259/g.23720 Transcript_8259/m.23720 type:complete len:214 (+) Transcript_8259:410-1051(+)|eukprot:CAMPEP_0117666596 /NCGR_PEP_ID=MMETSP0804-20121206/10465_1 /TAXON_ID=1074897 /ORGANISM="Tetraselmis astigmatica, Strain CCMP880" /LENGTH=213 /DNA_ID=CAMNT_0005474161 /DNA_START=406 /DNA_END=1047 /DNA_ORIENTATION=-
MEGSRHGRRRHARTRSLAEKLGFTSWGGTAKVDRAVLALNPMYSSAFQDDPENSDTGDGAAAAAVNSSALSQWPECFGAGFLSRDTGTGPASLEASMENDTLPFHTSKPSQATGVVGGQVGGGQWEELDGSNGGSGQFSHRTWESSTSGQSLVENACDCSTMEADGSVMSTGVDVLQTPRIQSMRSELEDIGRKFSYLESWLSNHTEEAPPHT